MPPENPVGIDDQRVRLIFTCCHPALAMEARLALTLRMLAGLTGPEIARAVLVREAAHGAADHSRQGRDQSRSHPHREPSPEDRHASRAYSLSSSSSSTTATGDQP